MKLAVISLWALAAALLVPSLAAANPIGPGGPRSGAADARDHRGDRRARVLERFDANRDGQLDDQERGALMAAKQQRRAKMKQRFDANGDGQLDRREKRQAKTAIRTERMQRRAQRLERMIQRFDRNGDGNLGPGEVPPRAQHRLKKLDRDGDGWVRPHEMQPQPGMGRDRMRGDGRMRRDRTRDDVPPPSQAPGEQY
ncbi:MAG: EF-hand domain-containing protein [Kofleriaceae bacterium]